MPARFADPIRAIRRLGVEVQRPSSGSHYKLVLQGKICPLSAHNGERSEISDRYIRIVCRSLGIDETELRRLL